MFGNRFRSLSLAVLCTLVLGSAFAQSRPEAEDIEASFLALVPAGWVLHELVVEVQENYGTEVEPDIRSRFRAAVVLQDDTYEAAGALGGANLLRPILSAGEERVYFGIARSVRRLGEWETTFTLENDPTHGTGSVLDSFSGRRLILGSEEEAEFRAGLEAEAEATAAAEVAELVRQERIRAEERAGELAEAAHVHALRQAELDAAAEAELTSVAQAQAHAAAMREQQAVERRLLEAGMAELLTELSEDVLPAELRVKLASHWDIESVEVTGSARRGTYEEPAFVIAFEAELELQEDTFTSREVDGGGLLLRSLQSAGASQQLTGTAAATWDDGTWQVSVDFENLNGFSAGLPRGFYPATAIVEGSSEETAYWKAVETAAEQELERELAAIARQAKLDEAQHEAVRTAAAQAAQLEAVELAARSIELAAFEEALESGDEALYWLTLEAILKGDDRLLIGRAIPLAFASGSTRLNELAMSRVLFDGGVITFSLGNPSMNLLLSELRMQPDGGVTGTLVGQSNNTSYRDEIQCGEMTGSIQHGHVALSNSDCTLLIEPLESDQLRAELVSRRNRTWTLSTTIPGYRGLSSGQ